jgi:hypothetical protein
VSSLDFSTAEFGSYMCNYGAVKHVPLEMLKSHLDSDDDESSSEGFSSELPAKV